MSVRIAEALVGRHLELAAAPALDAVHRALALLPRQAAATVRVHPDDVATLPDLTDALPGGSVVVVADPTVEPGGCVAEAGDRTVDARLEHGARAPAGGAGRVSAPSRPPRSRRTRCGG